ncbi:hypothetical protein HPB48_026339 [Haemaphysalis longicornis]|uniref:Uncharacterized protein n=1 Tax=Haemaphysalis longicornis TaxID=44386 RepID=A0A9J6HBM2_HAELO|nr:hypothetical protein HPB48_026339 [Haemaphysalis longicornis]
MRHVRFRFGLGADEKSRKHRTTRSQPAQHFPTRRVVAVVAPYQDDESTPTSPTYLRSDEEIAPAAPTEDVSSVDYNSRHYAYCDSYSEDSSSSDDDDCSPEPEESSEEATEMGQVWFDSYLICFCRRVPLYPGAKLTRGQSLVMVMAHSLRHHSSKEATESLLRVIEAHLPEERLGKQKFPENFYRDVPEEDSGLVTQQGEIVALCLCLEYEQYFSTICYHAIQRSSAGQYVAPRLPLFGRSVSPRPGRGCPLLQQVAFDSEVLRSVTFLPEVDEVTLGKFFTGRHNENRHHVRALHFTDCVALASQALLYCAAACSSLRALYIVNCAVDPTQLFELLPEKLRHLQVLEWSLLEDRFYWSWVQDAVPDLAARADLARTESLISMYVDVVATPRNVFMMGLIFNMCPNLLRLHVHAIPKQAEHEADLGIIAEIMRSRPGIETFTYTSERIPKPGIHGQESSKRNEGPRRFVPDGTICGNISYRLTREGNCSLVTLTDVLEQKASLRHVRQAIVAVEESTQAGCHLHAAASKPEFFKDVHSLTLVLFQPRNVMFPQAAAVHPKYLHPLRLLFKDSVSAITELNLTAFHFSCTADGSRVIGSALRLLRELAIAPCGVNHPGSLKYLARGCHFLEVLDVRTDQDSPLPQLPASVALQREVLRAPQQADQAPVSELRLHTSPRFYVGLGRLLSANPHLSALTIEDSHLTLGRGPLATELAEVHTLRRLIVLSSNPTADGAASLFTELLEDQAAATRDPAHSLSGRPPGTADGHLDPAAARRHDSHDVQLSLPVARRLLLPQALYWLLHIHIHRTGPAEEPPLRL